MTYLLGASLKSIWHEHSFLSLNGPLNGHLKQANITHHSINLNLRFKLKFAKHNYPTSKYTNLTYTVQCFKQTTCLSSIIIIMSISITFLTPQFLTTLIYKKDIIPWLSGNATPLTDITCRVVSKAAASLLYSRINFDMSDPIGFNPDNCKHTEEIEQSFDWRWSTKDIQYCQQYKLNINTAYQ